MKNYQCLIVLIFALISNTLFSQDCKCEKEHKRIFEQEKSKWMKGQYSDELIITEHPVTTFSKFHVNSYYNRSNSQSGRLSKLRDDIQSLQSLTGLSNVDPRYHAQFVYDKIYDIANIKLPALDAELQASDSRLSKYPHIIAYIAKNAAFVYLADMDKEGNKLADTTSARFRDKAIKCLKFIGSSNNVTDMVKWTEGDFTGAYSTYAQRYSKNLIMYAQAYDYLMGVIQTLDPTANATNTTATNVSELEYAKNADLQEQMEWLGLYVQCYAQKLYDKMTTFGVSPMYRLDNHALMTAGALGVAGVVLSDFSHKNSKSEWHPETWAHAAHSKINRVLFEENTIINSSKRGGTYGFSEGPYYWKWTSENLLPFFLAFKNAYPSDVVNKNFTDWKVYNKTRKLNNSVLAAAVYVGDWRALLSLGGLSYGGKTLAKNWYGPYNLYHNYWDDNDVKNIYRWSAELEMPNGHMPTIDDSWEQKPFAEKAILRDPIFLPTT
ncbi:MAG: hypothetical protein KDC92_13270 [Bacteroidetes bacterium]|nr:hypothetical protein [Bacteroidota bacterium]